MQARLTLTKALRLTRFSAVVLNQIGVIELSFSTFPETLKRRNLICGPFFYLLYNMFNIFSCHFWLTAYSPEYIGRLKRTEIFLLFNAPKTASSVLMLDFTEDVT